MDHDPKPAAHDMDRLGTAFIVLLAVSRNDHEPLGMYHIQCRSIEREQTDWTAST